MIGYINKKKNIWSKTASLNATQKSWKNPVSIRNTITTFDCDEKRAIS